MKINSTLAITAALLCSFLVPAKMYAQATTQGQTRLQPISPQKIREQTDIVENGLKADLTYPANEKKVKNAIDYIKTTVFTGWPDYQKYIKKMNEKKAADFVELAKNIDEFIKEHKIKGDLADPNVQAKYTEMTTRLARSSLYQTTAEEFNNRFTKETVAIAQNKSSLAKPEERAARKAELANYVTKQLDDLRATADTLFDASVQGAQNPDDDLEKLFKDFCMNFRDSIIKDVVDKQPYFLAGALEANEQFYDEVKQIGMDLLVKAANNAPNAVPLVKLAVFIPGTNPGDLAYVTNLLNRDIVAKQLVLVSREEARLENMITNKSKVMINNKAVSFAKAIKNINDEIRQTIVNYLAICTDVMDLDTEDFTNILGIKHPVTQGILQLHVDYMTITKEPTGVYKQLHDDVIETHKYSQNLAEAAFGLLKNVETAYKATNDNNQRTLLKSVAQSCIRLTYTILADLKSLNLMSKTNVDQLSGRVAKINAETFAQ